MKDENLIVKSLDEILKLTPEQFTDIMNTKDMGYLNSVKNFIQMYFEQVNVTKDSMLALVTKGENMPKEDKEKAQQTLNDLYVVMQLLEDRHNIIKAILDERNLG